MTFTLSVCATLINVACSDLKIANRQSDARREQCTGKFTEEMSSANKVLSQQYSGVTHEAFFVVRRGDEWTSLWKKICKMCIDPAPGNVDFKTEMLIVAALGEHSGAYQSTVDSLTVVDGVMEIVVRKSVAGPNCVITTGNMQPIEVVRVQKSNCTARFIRVTEEHAC